LSRFAATFAVGGTAALRTGDLVVILSVALDAHAGEEEDLGAMVRVLITHARSGLRRSRKLQHDAHDRTYQRIAPENETPNAFDLRSFTGKES
jgi:hypothetical protein